MVKLRLSKWWGLYVLLPLMVGLMVIDDEAAMSETWHLILLAGIAVAICALALVWVDRHPRLVEQGVAGLTDNSEVARTIPAEGLPNEAVEDDREPAPIQHYAMDEQGQK